MATDIESVVEAGPATISVPRGAFIAMAGGRWFKCDDVNMQLSRTVTRIGIALGKFGYSDGIGAENKDIESFTVRQYYQDRRPSLDYTQKSINAKLDGWEKYLGVDRRSSIVAALKAPLKLFEKQYKNYERENEALLALEGSGLTV